MVLDCLASILILIILLLAPRYQGHKRKLEITKFAQDHRASKGAGPGSEPHLAQEPLLLYGHLLSGPTKYPPNDFQAPYLQ